MGRVSLGGDGCLGQIEQCVPVSCVCVRRVCLSLVCVHLCCVSILWLRVVRVRSRGRVVLGSCVTSGPRTVAVV